MDPPSREAVMLAINHLMELVTCCFLCRIGVFRAVALCVLPGRSDCTSHTAWSFWALQSDSEGLT